MGKQYLEKYDLTEIFGNEKLRGKLPIIKYKATETGSGRTQIKSVPFLVFDLAKSAAKPYYKPFKPHKLANIITLDGKTEANLDEIVNKVYENINASKHLMELTENYVDIIRSALKEGEKTGRMTGQKPKLSLRQQTMLEIENLSKAQTQEMFWNIVEDIFFSGNYPKTVQKYGIDKLSFNRGRSFTETQALWQRRVGKQ